MSNPYEQRPAWTRCNYCQNSDFNTLKQFTRHLREKHCSKEGGSFVCHYGENSVCCTLPVEGVSDADYEKHVSKHHTFTTPFISNSSSRKSSTASERSVGDKWTVFSAVQNLPAVLNDPNKGKQRDFFTKTWGDSFVEVTDIPEPHYLPHITIHHFEHYLKKIAKKHKRHLKLNALAPKPDTHADLLQTFPNLRVVKQTEKTLSDLSAIPKIFLKASFDLSNKETFSAVYTHSLLPNYNNNNVGGSGQPCFEPTASTSAKLLQEKLTHYLDMVEVQIAQQVAQKSDAFFHAMTSHDALMEQLGQNIQLVKMLREKIHKIDKDLVKDSLNILKVERSRAHHQQVYRKLKVMSTVMQTQPTIQLLLSSPDYVGALDLIHTTQDLLTQDLAGIHSFRHLSSELSEMLKVIDNLMAEEFERHSTAELNRPLEDAEPQVLEAEKLTCIVLGLVRRGGTAFTDAYKGEAMAALRAAVKQAAIGVVARSEANNDVPTCGDLEDQLKSVSLDLWGRLVGETVTALLRLLTRVKRGHDIMLRAVDMSAGKHVSDVLLVHNSTDWILDEGQHDKAVEKLHNLLIEICQFAQDRCVHLLSNRSLVWPDEKGKEDSKGVGWSNERRILNQLKELHKQVEAMSLGIQAICPEAPTLSLKSSFSLQATKFVSRFHSERLNKLVLILESEPWKQTDVPASFQQLIDHIAEKGKFSVSKEEAVNLKNSEKTKLESYLFVDGEKFAVCGTVVMVVNMGAEYCACGEEVALPRDALLRHVSDLLSQFNARCYKLVLGGEAVSERTGLKKITTANLALLLRALHLLLWLLPHVKLHFQGLLGSDGSSRQMSALDSVAHKLREHSRDVHLKLLDIVGGLVAAELRRWEARPPAPSKAFHNIAKHLTKLSEAVTSILPSDQVQELYRRVNTKFKETLSDRLQKLSIVNNGGPQHGLVITELTFYLEDLKKVSGLPPESLDLAAMNDIWTPRTTPPR